MSVSLQTGVFRVLDEQGATRGTAFLLTGALAVTCHHVAEKTGWRIRLALHTGGEPVEAKCSPEDRHPEQDVAFLRLAYTPAGAQPLRLGRAGESGGHDYLSLGYPADGSVQGR
ncbi:MAG: serine protease, partial [Caldilineae bacterium]